MKIAIAADHGGYDLKQALMAARPDIEWLDIGAGVMDPADDYPDYGFTLAMAVAGGHAPLGLAICGSGIGISMALNRHPYIRAALCTSPEMARLAREHNAANVLCLGGRLTSADQALDILKTFVDTPFSAEERHTRRVQKLMLQDDGPAEDGAGGGCCGGHHHHDHDDDDSSSHHGGCHGDGSCGGHGHCASGTDHHHDDAHSEKASGGCCGGGGCRS